MNDKIYRNLILKYKVISLTIFINFLLKQKNKREIKMIENLKRREIGHSYKLLLLSLNEFISEVDFTHTLHPARDIYKFFSVHLFGAEDTFETK